MKVIEIQNSVKFSLPVFEHEYIGGRDNCNFRYGNGEEKWKKEEFVQRYTGQFLNDCLHSYGTYKWYNIDRKYHHTYEGQFFTNNLEGYGIFSFPDSTIFEGLFKLNERFGPGVASYPNGSQDVGIWKGNHLVRLNQILEEKSVPIIAETVKGKAYLLNFKFLVPVQEEKRNPAVGIMKSSEANDDVLQMSDKLYNKFVRNRNSMFFNNQEYQDCYSSCSRDWTIDIVDAENNCTKKVLVTHLVAWNNEDLSISVMRHTFENRRSENLVSFEICNTLIGARSLFREPGLQEISLIELLQSCCDGDTAKVVRLITSFDLYADISDFRGNNSIMYAAAHDQCLLLQTLTNFGANVDHLNDECLTALINTILRFTAYKFDVANWELAFIPSIELKEDNPEIQEWNTRAATRSKVEEEQKYLFDLSCKHPVEEKKIKSKGDKHNISEKRKSKGREGKKSIQEPEIELNSKLEKLNRIVNTINCLLNCGAKPNYGECPFPPLILSVFANSPEIIDILLKFGADTNIRTAYHLGNLTPLHITASLAPSADSISTAAILLKNGANPNLTANTIHWKDETDVILAGTEIEDTGKTPLHLLCMRYDFLNDIDNYLGQLASLLINFGADLCISFLGHTPLTLALIRGNIKLMDQILNTGYVDPNECLGNNMGVPLTVLILKRYESILPANICEKAYDTLINYYANPLNDVPYFNGNTIEFCNAENVSIVSNISPLKDKKAKSRKGDKSSKHQQIMNILFEAGETTLNNRINKSAVQTIYIYHIECKFEDPIFHQIVKFLTLNSTRKYLQMLLDHDAIVPSRTFCLELLEFVEGSLFNTQKKPKGKGKNLLPNGTIYDIVKTLDFDKAVARKRIFKSEVPIPEMDTDVGKFKVCFQCLQKTNKILLLCPYCNLVYFCSQECNIKNINRKDTRHPCKMPFYNNELALMQERLARGESEPSNKFQRFHDLREELMSAVPDYFEKLKQYDSEKTASRESEEEMKKAGKEGRAGRKKDRDTKTKDGRGKGAKGSREMQEKEDKKGSKRSRERQEKEGKKGRGMSDSKGNKYKKRKSNTSRGKHGKHKDKDGRNESKYGRHKDKKYLDKEDRYKDKGERLKGRDGLNKDKYERNKTERGDRDRSASHERDEKDKIISLGREEKGLIRKDLDGFATDELRGALYEVCRIYDEEYFAMFMPYCICVNGQLYYKFDNCQGYRELTYSDI